MSVRSFLDRYLSRNQEILLSYYEGQLRTYAREYRDNAPAVVGALVIAFFLVLALTAPYLAPEGPTETVANQEGLPLDLAPPSVDHPMGTTHLARDVFSQWWWGSRISLMVGAISGVSVMVVGTLVGLLAGYYRGNVDLLLMRVVDMLFGIPTLPLILVVGMFLGASVWNVVIIMALVMWRNMARVIRAEALSQAQRPYVKSARAAGASDKRIMAVHIVPNLLPLAITEGTIAAGLAVILEASISFLGYGAQGTVSWGSMLQLAFSSGAIRFAWWWVIPPGISITILVVSFFFVARGVEAVANPEKQRGVI